MAAQVKRQRSRSRSASLDMPPPRAPAPRGAAPKSAKVADMVGRSKRVAGSMFVLLHAERCDGSCQVENCTAVRALLARMKQNGALTDVAKQTGEPAAVRASKLLHHFYECRDLRAAATPRAPHYCLVCSLVARARMEQGEKQKLFKLNYSAATSGRFASIPDAPPSPSQTGGRRARSNSWDALMAAATTREHIVAPAAGGAARAAEPAAFSSSAPAGAAKRALDGGGGSAATSAAAVAAAAAAAAPADSPATKRSRSMSWGGEWKTGSNSALALDLMPVAEAPGAAAAAAAAPKSPTATLKGAAGGGGPNSAPGAALRGSPRGGALAMSLLSLAAPTSAE